MGALSTPRGIFLTKLTDLTQLISCKTGDMISLSILFYNKL